MTDLRVRDNRGTGARVRPLESGSGLSVEHYIPVALASAAAIEELTAPSRRRISVVPASSEQVIFDRLVDLKVETAQIAMHLQSAWRSGLFHQLDDLLDAEYWNLADTLPELASFRTFLRLLNHLGRPRRPGLAVTDDGNIVATWTVGRNRLTIECRPSDWLVWVLAREFNAEVATTAGKCSATVLKSLLAPYHPEVWFDAN